MKISIRIEMDLTAEGKYSKIYFFIYFNYLVNKLSVVTAGNVKSV